MDIAENEGTWRDAAPLRAVVFALLVILGEEDLHGYELMKRVNERLGRQAIVGPGTLYRNLKELREAGWIEHTDGPPHEDARRQYYTLSGAGRRVAASEAARMAELVSMARAGGLLRSDGAGL